MKQIFSSEHVTIVDYGATIYYRMSASQLSFDMVQQAINSRLSIISRDHYGFFDYRDVKKVDLAALKALCSDDAYAYVKASVVLLSGELGAVLGDIYYNMRQPSFQSQYFIDPEEAFSWFSQFEDAALEQLRSDLFKTSEM